MKRVSVQIQITKDPETLLHGSALYQDLGEKRIAFFMTQKLPDEETVRITYTLHGNEIVYEAVTTQIQEQISSGRVMTSMPTEENPFPAVKFFRYFANVISRTSSEQPAEAAPDNVVPITAAPPTDAQPAEEVKAA